LTFCKRNNAEIILLINFCVFLLLLFFFYQTVILQKKKGCVNIYMDMCELYIYIYSYMKNFLSGLYFSNKFCVTI